ncbi:hypothetical protein E2C01_092907 [Portunus trituberculatus]|uniref:Uncharacterized protein n=1 Tax=Portunus trituberculatus TaxID=210409 RepID=A0A5B7JWR7_PORTR|nr:hypothetical protein [Portunus trituberculatus]
MVQEGGHDSQPCSLRLQLVEIGAEKFAYRRDEVRQQLSKQSSSFSHHCNVVEKGGRVTVRVVGYLRDRS